MTATVQAINMAKREVTLRGPKGELETLMLGPEVKNLSQVAVGDQVVAEFHRGLFLALQEKGEPDVTPEMTAAVAKAGQGEKPAAAAGAQIRATVTVKAIDMDTRKVTLVGPEGGEYQVEAGPGIKLNRLKAGDRVAATYTEAVAISVEPMHKK